MNIDIKNMVLYKFNLYLSYHWLFISSNRNSIKFKKKYQGVNELLFN